MTIKPAKKRSLTPRLRFPEFRDTGEWEEVQLAGIASPVADKATNGDGDTVLTLSAEHGIVAQGTYFDKQVAGNDVKRYIKIILDDFVYNDRTTKTYRYGTIKRLSFHKNGIVSPIYKCFRFGQKEIPAFWEWYFESGTHDHQLHSLINEGAREGRFNISIQQFLSRIAWRPGSAEQQRIADCLSSLDERITVEMHKLDALKAHKKGLLGQIFPVEGETVPRLRFPAFQDAGEWEKRRLGNITDVAMCKRIFAEETNGKSGVPFFKIGTLGGNPDAFISKELFDRYQTTYKFPRKGEVLITCSGTVGKRIIYDGQDAYYQDSNIVWIDNESLEIINQLLFYLLEIFNWKKLNSTTITRIYGDDLRNITLTFPMDNTEQQRIADCLSSLDELIAAQTQKLDLLKAHKKGLMQQLFPAPNEVQA